MRQEFRGAHRGVGSASAPSNNEMKLTKPRRAKMGAALQLISVFGGP